jgi:solute carrier family 26 (sodium-independent sulfate anion transporter), member 11
LSIVNLLLRFSRPRFDTLGRLPLQSTKSDDQKHTYVPLDHPSFESVKNPPDGVLIFRFIGSLIFPSSRYIDSKIIDYVHNHTKKLYVRAARKGDRPWNESSKKEEISEKTEDLPRLNAVIYDFSAVGIIDSTGVHALADIRKELNKYSNHYVEFHFVNITSESIEDSLIAAGFGTLEGGEYGDCHHGSNGSDETVVKDDEESAVKSEAPRMLKRFFHLTIDEAIAAATSN